VAHYFTKHHPTSHHIKIRPIDLHTGNHTQVSTPDCRGVFILDSGLPESSEPVRVKNLVDTRVFHHLCKSLKSTMQTLPPLLSMVLQRTV
jgi:hypothetical protein